MICFLCIDTHIIILLLLLDFNAMLSYLMIKNIEYWYLCQFNFCDSTCGIVNSRYSL